MKPEEQAEQYVKELIARVYPWANEDSIIDFTQSEVEAAFLAGLSARQQP